MPTSVKGRSYIISLSVKAYQRGGLNLRFAVNNARQMQDGLTKRLIAQGEIKFRKNKLSSRYDRGKLCLVGTLRNMGQLPRDLFLCFAD